MPKVSALLSVSFEDGEYDLPFEVRELLRRFSDSVPTTFYLPWPVEAIPDVGRTLNMNGLATGIDELRVEDLQYDYSSEYGVIVYIVTNRWDSAKFGMAQLVTCAEEGFLAEKKERPPLREILAGAGLPTTYAEFEKLGKE